MTSLLNTVSFDCLDDQKLFETVRTSATYHIQKHIQRSNCFKLVLNISRPKETILPAIVEPANYALWNSEVIKADTKMKLFRHNYTVCRQVHRPYNSKETPREFLYLRHLFVCEGRTYMVDRSIDMPEFPPDDNIIRGVIPSCIWRVQNTINARMTQLVILLEMLHQAPLTINQQAELTLRYL
jgi:hypothetical protein